MSILAEEVSCYPENLLENGFEQSTLRRWWAIYVKARQEKSLARDLLAHEVPFFLPLLSKRLVYKRRTVVSHIPLFTGYLFLFGDEDERILSTKTNRVSRIIPVADQDELRQDLTNIARLLSSRAPLVIENGLKPGSRVRVCRGPFLGVEGTIVARHRSFHLVVAVNFLQQGVSLEIDEAAVEPID